MKNVAIITGGDSKEFDISLKSAETVFKNIDRKKYNPYLILIKNDKWEIKIEDKLHDIDSSLKAKVHGKELNFKLVFMALHGPPAENGELQISLEKNNIKYTCCDSKTSKLTFDKFRCNQLLFTKNYFIANSILISKDEVINIQKIETNFNLPLIVKPNQAGSSNGISLVKNYKEIFDAIKLASVHDNEVIIEEYIKGTEVSCGILKIKDQINLLPITEIVSENDFFDYDAKYNNKSEEITPARITKNETKLIHQTTEKIYKELGLKGICRIDFIIKNSKPFVIEINTIPGLSEKSIIPKQLEAAGYNLKEVFSICLEN
ncbi:MAG: ATP-grasp domain-containing protein [Flavobacteriales bacterium]|nr:ATP-grasp domain-containing protein [Flavobacteriales bacterium]